MSDLSFRCGDYDALVSYLYDECDDAARQRIGAHLAHCATCASEVDGLGQTRRQLAAWVPPEVRLDVRVAPEAQADRLTTAGAARPVRTRPSAWRWWTQPLPAWAQAAAALLIFAAGFSTGAVRGDPSGEPAPIAAVSPASDPGPVAAIPASTEDLVALEERLRAQFGAEFAGLSRRVDQVDRAAQVARVATPAVSVSPEDVESLRRQMNMLAQQTFAAEAQRQFDRQAIEQALGQFQGATGEAMQRQGEQIGRLVSYVMAQPRR